MSATPDGAGGVYEVTVEGVLGPVLGRALRLERVEVPVACTTLRTTARDDLPDLVALLESHGLVIEGVWLLSTPVGVGGGPVTSAATARRRPGRRGDR